MTGLSLSRLGLGLGLGSSSAGTPTPTPSFTVMDMGQGTNGLTLEEEGLVETNGVLNLAVLTGSNQYGQLYRDTVTPDGVRYRSILQARYPFSGVKVDNHTIPSQLKLASGQSVFAYSPHDGAANYYALTVGDSSAFTSFKQVKSFAPPAGYITLAYVRQFLLGTTAYWCTRASTAGGNRPLYLYQTSATNLAAGTETWTSQKFIEVAAHPDARPYYTGKHDFTNDIHYFMVTDGHCEEVAGGAGVWAGKLVNNAGNPKIQTLAGVDKIFPCDPTTDLTLLKDNSGGSMWMTDVAIGADGHPRFLAYQFPVYNGGGNNTDAKIWHFRWDGSAIVANQILAGQYNFPKNVYTTNTGQACFDEIDPTIIYIGNTSGMSISSGVTALSAMEKWQITESSGAMTKLADIETGNVSQNPISPQNNQSKWPLLYGHGTSAGAFPSYQDYTDTMRGQMLFSAYTAPQVALQSETTTWLNALANAASMSQYTKDYINWAIYQLKTLGLWTGIDCFYLPKLCASIADAKINIKTPGTYDLINVGTGCTWTAGTGFTGTGNATGNYLQISGGNPLALPSYVRDSNSAIIHVTNVSPTAAANNVLGPATGTAQDLIQFPATGLPFFRSSSTVQLQSTIADRGGGIPNTAWTGWLDGSWGYNRTSSAGLQAWRSSGKLNVANTSTSFAQTNNDLMLLRDGTMNLGGAILGAGRADDDLSLIMSIKDTLMAFAVAP